MVLQLRAVGLSRAAWERAYDEVRSWGLDAHDPALGSLLASIDPDRGSPTDERLFALLLERLRPYRAYAARYPFPVAPPSAGRFVPGVQRATGGAFRLDDATMQENLLVVGPTGSGKSTLVGHLVDQAHESGLDTILIDLKDDLRSRAAVHERSVILDANANINLLAPCPLLPLAEHIAQLTDDWCRTLWVGESGRQVMHEALTTCLARPYSTMADLLHAVRSLQKPTDTYSRRDAVRGLILRLERLRDRYPGPCTSPTGVSLDTLCAGSVYVGFQTHTELEDFFILRLVTSLFWHHRIRGHRTLSHLVVLEEGMLTSKARSNTIQGTAPLSDVHGLTREFGISMLTTSTTLTLLDPHLKANAGTLIALRPNNAAELLEASRTLGLSKAAEDYFRGMPQGECLVRTRSVPHTVLCTFPFTPRVKTVDPARWEEARRRINRLQRPGTTTWATPPPAIPPSRPPHAPSPSSDDTARRPSPSPLTTSSNSPGSAPNRASPHVSATPGPALVPATHPATAGDLAVARPETEPLPLDPAPGAPAPSPTPPSPSRRVVPPPVASPEATRASSVPSSGGRVVAAATPSVSLPPPLPGFSFAPVVDARAAADAASSTPADGPVRPSSRPTPMSPGAAPVSPLALGPAPPTTTTETPGAVLRLTRNDERLLRYLCERGGSLTAAAYAAIQVLAQVGDRSRSRLLQAGFLRADRVRTGQGRGRSGAWLSPTSQGYARVGVRPPRRGRGAGAQHAYLVVTLAELLGGTIEYPAPAGERDGGATAWIDLLVVLDTERHARLLEFLQARGTWLALTPPSLDSGVHVAVEVEVSDPSAAAKNASKDLAARISLVVSAVLPGDEHVALRALHTLDPHEQERVVLTNALALLDALRKA